MKKLLSIIRNFRQRHLFVFPSEARVGVVIAQQLAREELESVVGEYRRAATALVEVRTKFRASKHTYDVNVSVDAVVLKENVELGLNAVTGEIMRQIRFRHEVETGRKS